MESSKLKALMELRKMVEEMCDEEFKTQKMPKIMAMKVTKVEEPEAVVSEISSDPVEGPETDLAMDEDMGLESDPGAEKVAMGQDKDSAELTKLKQLLMKRK